MIFYLAKTPDGWAIPGVHGNWAEDELDGNVQGSVFLIKNREEALLFDTGNAAPGTQNSMHDFLVTAIDQEHVALKYIFISHFHYDHTGNADALRRRYGATVLAHKGDAPLIEDPLASFVSDRYHSLGISPEEIREDFNLAEGQTFGLSDPQIIKRYWNFPVQVDKLVNDGERLSVGDWELEVVALPGHTPGHTGLWNPATSSLYVGDLGHFPTPLSPFPTGDAEDHINSIQRAIQLNAGYLWEGHALGAYEPAAVRRRLLHLAQMQQDTIARIKEVLHRGGRPLAISDMLNDLFPIKGELNYPVKAGTTDRYAYAEACIQAHLRRLMMLNEVERVRESGMTLWRAL